MERPTTPRDRPRLRAAAALVLSLAANAAALAALGAVGAFHLAPPPSPARVILAALSPEAWEAHRRVEDVGARAAARPAAPEAARPRPRAPDPEGTLARVAPAPDMRRPERARFLAERDGSVERETRFRGPRPEAPVVALAPRPTPGAPGAGGAAQGEEGIADATAPGRPGDPGAVAARRAAARLALAPPGEGDLAVRPAAVVLGEAGRGEGDGGGARRGRHDPRTLPFAEGRAAAGGGAPSGDPLPGVSDGDATLVNTRGFRFAGFYGRVREAIAGEWKPNRAWDARDPHDRLLGRVRRQVQVDILLEADGSLRDLRLVRGSGLGFFDAECLRAIREAAPFPNPPRGLVGPDGVIALRGWRLVFEFGPEDVLDRWLPAR